MSDKAPKCTLAVACEVFFRELRAPAAAKCGPDNSEHIMNVPGGRREKHERPACFRMELQGLPGCRRHARLRAQENGWEFITVPAGGSLGAGKGDEVFSVSRGGGGR